MKKILLILLCSVLLISSVFLMTRDFWFKIIIEEMLWQQLGLRIHVVDIHSNLWTGKVKMENVVVDNPPGFKRKMLGYMPNFTVYIEPFGLIQKGKLHFNLLDFELEKINVIRDKKNRVNLKLVAKIIKARAKSSSSISIDYVRFDIKDVFFYDENSETAKVRAYTIDQYGLTYENLNSFKDVVDLVTEEVLTHAKLRETLNYITVSFFENIRKVPSKTVEVLTKPSGNFFQFFSKPDAVGKDTNTAPPAAALLPPQQSGTETREGGTL